MRAVVSERIPVKHQFLARLPWPVDGAIRLVLLLTTRIAGIVYLYPNSVRAKRIGFSAG